MMRAIAAALALVCASPVFAQGPSLGAAAAAVALFPLTAAFNDLRSKLGLLGRNGAFDAAIRTLTGGPDDPAEDARVFSAIAIGYIHCQRALVEVGNEMRAMRMRL